MNPLIETLNLWGDRFASFALPMLVQSSLLIALLFLVDAVIHRHVRAVLRYALWLLLPIKLILPPSFAVPTSIGYWLGASPPRQRAEQKPSTAAVRISNAPANMQKPATTAFNPKIPPLDPSAVVLVLWLSGGAGLFAFLLRRTRRVRLDVAVSVETSGERKELLDTCRQQLGLRRSVRLKISRQSMSPAVCGLWRPVILIPDRLVDKLSNSQLRGVLLHELAHIKRNDVRVNYAQTLLQILYWWHPFLWLANAHIRRIREQAVDEMVMVALAGEAEIYPATLIEVARHAFTRPTVSLGLIGIVESRSALKQRITRLLNRPVPKSAKLGLADGLAVALAAALLLPMAHGQTKQITAVVPAAAADQATVVNLEVKFIELPGPELEALNLGAPSMTTDTGHLAWELTSDQVSNLVQRLGDQDNVTLLAAPRITARSGTQTRIEIVDPYTIGTANTNSNKPLASPACELIPRVNGGQIDLTVIAKVTETGTLISNPSGNLELRASPPDENLKPDARNGSVYAVNAIGYVNYDVGTAQVSVADGGGVVLQNPAVKNSKGNNFLVIVSPTIDRTRPGNAQISPLNDAQEDRPPVQGQRATIAAVASLQPSPNDIRAVLPVVTVAKIPPYLSLGSEPVTLENLRAEFAQAAARDSAVGLSLRVEHDAAFSNLFQVLEVAKAASMRSVSVMTADQPSGTQSPPADTLRSKRALVTRTFKLNPVTFQEYLRKTFPSSAGTNVAAMVRDLFQAAGVHTGPPNVFFFSDRTGMLMVRASEEELDMVQKAIGLLMPSPAQITLETRFAEIPPAAARKLGLDLPVSGGTTNTWSRILTAREAQSLLRVVEQLDGVDLLAAPNVTTLSGRQTQIQVVELKTIVVGINPQALAAPGVQSSNGASPPTLLTSVIQVGPRLDVTPEVGTDGYTVRLMAAPTVTEFLGYDTTLDDSKQARVWVNGKEGRVTVPLPRLRTRRMQVDATVNDGQTLVLGNPVQTVAATKPDGETQSATGPEDTGKRLLAFITPTIIDPAGNPIHPPSKEALPSDTVPSRSR